MARQTGWIPQQHGAWAMLAVPCLVALSLAIRTDGVDALGGRLLLVATFWSGYFAFNACSLWLKSRRRARFRRPLVAYSVATALLGLSTLAVIGLGLLPWGIVYLPLTLATLLLVARGQERSVASGALTVAAATGFAATILRPTPLTATTWALPVGVTAVCFGYFFGTVWFVKTMLRRRGERAWFAASIGWHALCGIVAAMAWMTGALSVGYVVFFALALIRAVVVPLLGPLARQPRAISPAQLGIMESIFSVALTVLLWWQPPGL